MLTIEEEVKRLIFLLESDAGYTISLNGDLTLSPVYGTRDRWEVYWEEQEGDTVFDYRKLFLTLEEAANYFVEKRRYLCLGVDFNQMYEAPDGEH